ncbi:phage tail protein [Dyella dinghuensis]|uniref:Phage tail protein n=1 Tax=Dyella dinghuensis TaxID=1920169 RepID=A0A3S0PED0_9GAMM|nr:tail fiber protein [Dyella dinghuensis]RUL63398.1 phage tail protein [Dyella dinghuensis]
MSTPFVGEIRLFSFTFAPVGWQLCDGSLLSISSNEVLYTLLGTTYGGDGVSTFAVPDLRGRVPVHQGTGNGLTPRVIGQIAGTESVTILNAQMPAHTHPFIAATSIATLNAPAATAELGGLGADTMYSATSAATIVSPASATVSQIGGNLPHDNLMPTLTASFCIALSGIFPSQG